MGVIQCHLMQEWMYHEITLVCDGRTNVMEEWMNTHVMDEWIRSEYVNGIDDCMSAYMWSKNEWIPIQWMIE